MRPDESPFRMGQLLELEACTRCGQCQKWCDAFTGEEFTSPKLRLKGCRAWLKGERLPSWLSYLVGGRSFPEEELRRFSDGSYRCTMCARCREVCPVGIDTLKLWASLREEMVDRDIYPPALNLLKQGVEKEHNVFNYPNQERATWLEFMAEVPEGILEKKRAEIVYFVGCVASFSPSVQGIPQALVSLLSLAGVDFTLMGEEEWCCGFPLLVAGMRREAQEVKAHNLNRVREIGPRAMVFSCPSCFRTWREEYQRELPGVRLMHSTQLLEALLQEGRLPQGRVPLWVTYHDPCDLGRNSGVYTSPRQVLSSINGVSLVEMDQSRGRAYCCGGGGDLEVSDPDLASRIAVGTLTRAWQTRAQAVITACQQCKRMFLNAEQKLKSGLKFYDIAELVLEATRKG